MGLKKKDLKLSGDAPLLLDTENSAVDRVGLQLGQSSPSKKTEELKSLRQVFLRHPEVMQPFPRHSRGQHDLKTVVKSNFRPEMAEK